MKHQKTINRHIAWIKEYKDYLNIFRIERDLDLPEGTLKKFVDGKRGLSDQWHKSVITWVKNFKK